MDSMHLRYHNPVLNTMMVEPTESESLDELKRFVDAMEMIERE